MLDFCSYDKDFLNLSWNWLNDEEIKKMTMTPDFTKKDQERFYEKISNSSDYKIFGIVLNKEKIGVCGLKNINESSGEFWGYIGEKRFWGMGYGSEMLSFIVNLAKSIELKTLYLKVSKENIRAISLYMKNKFLIKKDFGDFYIMERFL